MRTIFLFLFVFGLCFLLNSCAHKKTSFDLCHNIHIEGPDKIDFSDTEKLLVCGDPTDPAYKLVPLYQAKFMLLGFLQSKGYSHPRFVYDQDSMQVFTDDKSKFKEIEVKAHDGIDKKRFERLLLKRYKGEVITPKLLDEIEKKTKSMARNEGFPCVKVTSEAQVLEGKIILDLGGLVAFNFGELSRSPVEGLRDEAFVRFTPFTYLEKFNEDALALAEKRYLRQGVVQGTYFKENCDLSVPSFSLSQDFIVGPPRTIHLGVGASTEVGPMVRASWAHQRFLSMASFIEAKLQASFKDQSLDLTNDQYFWKDSPRRSLKSELHLERNHQERFEERMASLTPLLQWTADHKHRFFLWSAGPSFIVSSFKTDQEEDTKSIRTAAVLGRFSTQTHSYEIFDVHPEEGNFLEGRFDFRHPALGFTDRLMKLESTFVKLFWLGTLGKGQSIFALRLNAATTWVKDVVNIAGLPPSVKFYGGGSDDLRGFKLNSLPDNSGEGALSKTSVKLEYRKTHFFEENLEGFTFLDSALFGARSWELDPQLWYSPGVGLRWFSPIGLVQGFVARSLTNRSSLHFDQDNGDLFFLGLGGVF